MSAVLVIIRHNSTFVLACFSPSLNRKDGYSTKDIVFKWIAGKTEVDVGNKEMAQFEYKGSRLTSGIDEFDTGQLKLISVWHF